MPTQKDCQRCGDLLLVCMAVSRSSASDQLRRMSYISKENVKPNYQRQSASGLAKNVRPVVV
jgi:hypothetical protein